MVSITNSVRIQLRIQNYDQKMFITFQIRRFVFTDVIFFIMIERVHNISNTNGLCVLADHAEEYALRYYRYSCRKCRNEIGNEAARLLHTHRGTEWFAGSDLRFAADLAHAPA